MPHKSTNGDAAASLLLRNVLWSLVLVTLSVTIISIFVPEERQGIALGLIEKLAIPIITGLMVLIHMKVTKVMHIVNSKSDKQDAEIAALKAQIKSGTQDARDVQQQDRDKKLQQRADSLDDAAVKNEKVEDAAEIAGAAAVAGAAAAVAAHEAKKKDTEPKPKSGE